MILGGIVQYEKEPISAAASAVYDLVNSTQETTLVKNVRNAVHVIEEAFDKYR